MRATSRDKAPTFDTSKVPNLIGLSLSLCIRDVIDGRVSVEQIDHIIANTCCLDEADWDSVTEQYKSWYWEADPERAARIVSNLRAMNKVDQPRTRGEHSHRYDYHWRQA